jgi:hypothetical protein
MRVLTFMLIKTIIELEYEGVAYRIMHSIMTKVDSIRFAEDYNGLSQAEKTKWLNEAYIKAHANLFEGVDAADIPAIFAERKVDVSAWKAQTGRQTMARNRLYQLFLNVSPRHPKFSL